MQRVPSHCGLPGNERADVLAGKASALPQDSIPIDVGTVPKAVARAGVGTPGSKTGLTDDTSHSWSVNYQARWESGTGTPRWTSTNRGPATGAGRHNIFMGLAAVRHPNAASAAM